MFFSSGKGMKQRDLRLDEISLALEHCYDAVLHPEFWPHALTSLASSFNAVHALFYPINPNRSDPNPLDPARPIQNLPASRDYKDLLGEYIAGSWHLNHYRAIRGVPLLEAGHKVVIEHDLASDDERRKIPHYNELYVKWGLPGFAMVGINVAGRPWAVPFMRGTNQGHFSPEEAARLADIAPHLARLINFSEKFSEARAATSLDTLDSLANAAVAIDWRGHVTRVNSRAAALLGGDLLISFGRLIAADPQSNKRLQSLVASIQAPKPGAPPPGRVFIRRRDNAMGAVGRPLVIDTLPLRGVGADVFGPSLAILVITDLALERSAPSLESSLRVGFGLTPAEARQATLFAEGVTLEEGAAIQGVTRETARSRLKAIFAKTGTHGQVELARLLARLVGP